MTRNGSGSARVTPSTVTWLLRHRLEQRRLRLRHRPVDLVDEQDVREDRSGAELEVARLLVVDREPGDVGRLQVGRALDARGLRVLDRAGDRAREDGLRGARDVLEEHVAAARERREHELDALGLAVHDRLDVREEAVGRSLRALEPFVAPSAHRGRIVRKRQLQPVGDQLGRAPGAARSAGADEEQVAVRRSGSR